MTEETPGFEEKPDVPSGATSDDAAASAESSEKEGPAAPAGDAAAKIAGLTAQLDQVRRRAVQVSSVAIGVPSSVLIGATPRPADTNHAASTAKRCSSAIRS